MPAMDMWVIWNPILLRGNDDVISAGFSACLAAGVVIARTREAAANDAGLAAESAAYAASYQIDLDHLSGAALAEQGEAAGTSQ